jgi:hypothetical protein
VSSIRITHLNASWKARKLPGLEDITTSLQHSIIDAKSKLRDPTQVVSILIPKGDYSIQTVTIPSNDSIQLHSKDRVRLIYGGKRNRPVFVIGENSLLILLEKIEIYYNTNNIHEAANLMVKCPKTSQIKISKGVKISLFSLKQPE